MTRRAEAGRAATLGAFCLTALALADCGSPPPGAASNATTEDAYVLAAPGRIEGATESIEIGASMDGIIEKVLVSEGDTVRAGDVLARIACEDLEQALAAARARAEAARQALVRVRRGAREEERREAEAATVAARAQRDRARERHDRLARLAQGDAAVSDEDVAQSRRDLDVAEAALHAAEEHETLVKAGPLPEEIARAEADKVSAEREARYAAARVDKCSIRAPIDGTILRRHLLPGEQVSLALPRPILTMADLSRRCVRAEVDERDVEKVRVGQKVKVTADALEGAALTGRVASIESLMGRKHVRTGDPAEKSDRDVLEVLVDLDAGGPDLPIGLRVTVRFAGSRSP